MTPEQEDAHWALLGKPLMRVWRLYRQLGATGSEYKRKAGQRFAAGDHLGAAVLSGYADASHDEATRIWNKYGFRLATGGAKADGVFYSNEEGMSHD